MKRVALAVLALIVFGGEAFAQPVKSRLFNPQSQQAVPGGGRTLPRVQPGADRPLRGDVQGVMPTVPALPGVPSAENLRDIRARFNFAYDSVKESCGGIGARVKAIQELAGWSTGVSGLGTLAAGGALGTGIAKAVVDKKIKTQEDEIEKLIADIEKMDDQQFFNFLVDLSWAAEMERFQEMNEKHGAMVDKSKTLGHWRTGLAAGATATSIAGTALAGQNFNLDTLIAKMDGCNKALGLMAASEAEMSATVLDGDFFSAEIGVAHKVLAACEPYDLNAIRAVETQQQTATIASAVGIGTGAIATTTSIIANLKDVRKDKTYEVNDGAAMAAEAFNVKDGKTEKEEKTVKGLNLAANIASGATAVTSGLATGFSIATLTAIGAVVDKAERCERAF